MNKAEQAEREATNQEIVEQLVQIAYDAVAVELSCQSLLDRIAVNRLQHTQPYSEIRRATAIAKQLSTTIEDCFGNLPRLGTEG